VGCGSDRVSWSDGIPQESGLSDLSSIARAGNFSRFFLKTLTVRISIAAYFSHGSISVLKR
jgi:hypothetical protein